jgi:hypothetical protein
MKADAVRLAQGVKTSRSFSVRGRVKPWHQLAGFFVAFAFLFTAFPETLIPAGWTHVGPVHVTNVVTPLACLFIFAAALFDRRSWPGWVWWVIAVSLLMLVHGLAREYEMRYLAQDGFVWMCFIAGLLWGNLSDPLDFGRQMKPLAIIFTLEIPIVIAGVSFGIIPPSPGPEGYLITRSLYAVATFLSVLGPLILTTTVVTRRGSSLIPAAMLLVGAVAGVIIISLYSTGRTVAILGAAFFLVSCRAWFRTGAIRTVFVVALASISVLFFVLLMTPNMLERSEAISQKFLLHLSLEEDNTGLIPTLKAPTKGPAVTTEEQRVLEVEDMFDELSGNELTGLGLGSTFVPSWIENDNELRSIGPHIGILTHLFKGGIIVFFVVGILPACWALNRFFVSRSNDAISLSIWGGVLVFFVSSCISGGYGQGAMFVYGILISMGLRWDKFSAVKLKRAKANNIVYDPRSSCDFQSS